VARINLGVRPESKRLDRGIDLSLCAITAEFPPLARSHLKVAEAAIDGGASVIQLREKTAPTREFLEEALKIRAATKKAKIPLIINDRLDIALAVDADGVHLGQEDLPVAVARRILGPKKIIGVSLGRAEEAKTAVSEGADYVALGPIFETASKSDARKPVGCEAVRKIRAALKIPVVAIGGINGDNVREVLEAGADGVAVISAISEAQNMKEATQSLLDKIRLYRR